RQRRSGHSLRRTHGAALCGFSQLDGDGIPRRRQGVESMEAKRTPLIELLERVPRDAVLVVEHDQFSSSSHPVGRLCHEAAAALEAARDGMTSPVTSPDQILLDAIEREIRQLEGKDGWLPQATRIANLRAAIDQARGKGVAGGT